MYTTHRISGIPVTVCDTAEEAGERAAARTADIIRTAAADGIARVIFASAPSQATMLQALARLDVPWPRVEALHMDDYIGLPSSDPRSFSQWLADRLPTDQMAAFHRIDGMAEVAAELRRYTDLVAAAPITLTCMGIGVNGHIAFNEPGDTSFTDSSAIREIVLEPESRQQQVDEECFASLAEVPATALTLTVPVLVSARSIVMTVLGESKARGVAAALRGPIGEAVPATAIRGHRDVMVFLDRGAASELGL
ncbi:MAG: 6-phosphogluconolactonase [Propionicimonas sp.]